MALNIKDPRTDALARELADVTGESITTALRQALEERLARVQREQRHVEGRREVLQGIIDRGRARPVLDDRPEDEILGYDENGVPG